MAEMETWERCLWAIRFEVKKEIADDMEKHIRAKVDHLTQLLREAYPYLPLATSLSEELAAMFPDIARPQDIT